MAKTSLANVHDQKHQLQNYKKFITFPIKDPTLQVMTEHAVEFFKPRYNPRHIFLKFECQILRSI